MTLTRCIAHACVAAAIWLGVSLCATAYEGPSFSEQVAPIFERHCVRCHQGSEPKGGLDLTTSAAALRGGDSGPAIVPSNLEASSLVSAVSGDKPEMPKDAPALSAQQVETLRQWIAAGAAWPADAALSEKGANDTQWWSLLPLTNPAVPAALDAWVRTPVDAFVLERLRREGLSPSAEADRRTLIRRLSYDLHGLPPKVEEVAAFVADERPDAYEQLVDRLLASPRYGERWGRYWLDVVHFGESHGYDKDKPRPNAWPYRDYVIDSLNADKPYDRFVAEQIAGDVLFPFEPAATVATGFIAAGPWDFVGHVELREGTVDKDIARLNDRDDMLSNAMSTFMSLTAHCARCHDHKFDPIRQADYYALQAVFAGVDRADRPYDADPTAARARHELLAQRQTLESRLKSIEERVAQVTSPEIVAIDKQLASLDGELKQLPAADGKSSLGYHSQIMSKSDETKWVQVDLGRSQSLEVISLVPSHVVYGGHPGPGFGFPSRFKVEVSESPDFATAQVVFDRTGEDYPHPGDTPLTIPVNVSGRYVRVTATRLWKRTDDWIFALSELVAMSGGVNVAQGKAVTALDSIEAPASWSTRYLVDGMSSTGALELDGTVPARDKRRAVEAKLEEMRSRREELVDQRLDATTRESRSAIRESLARVGQQLAQLPPPLQVYAAANQFGSQGSFKAAATARPIHLLARGDVRSPREAMRPAGLPCVQGPQAEFALDESAGEGARRAALAAWLIDPRNALLRRSIVNRVWHYHFGQGLVDTPNDFGRMGSLPSHPELLDWLAGWFAKQGHSLKALHRLLLTSAAYRQSSANRPEAARIDAGNRLLWRMNRQRLDAECVRDAMLAVSGKLDLAMGGPSVQQFFFKDDHSPVYDYASFDVDDPRSYRRSVYRFLVRSVPDPFMECLDCADPSIMTPKRNTTLTSIQALALLNNPLAVRQAEHFAARAQISDDVGEQVALAWQTALGRPPEPKERDALTAYAQKFGLPAACRVILNSNEFLFVD